MPLVSLLLSFVIFIVNRFYTFCSAASIDDFEQENYGWVFAPNQKIITFITYLRYFIYFSH